MGERHVSCTEMMEAPEHRHTSANAVSALDADEAGYKTVSVRLFQLSTRGDEPHLLGVFRRETSHHVYLLESKLHGVEELCLAWHVCRPELRADDPATQPLQVRLPRWTPRRVLRQIRVEWQVSKTRAAALLAQCPCEIVVPAIINIYIYCKK